MTQTVVYSPDGQTLLGYRRTLAAIFADLSALTAAQKTAVWADLTSAAGGVKKYQADDGDCASGIAALDWIVTNAGASGANLTAAQLRIAACYVQDNPQYLDGVTVGGQSFAVKGYDPI